MMASRGRGKKGRGTGIGIYLHNREDIERFEALKEKVSKELGVGRMSRAQFVMYMVKRMEEKI